MHRSTDVHSEGPRHETEHGGREERDAVTDRGARGVEVGVAVGGEGAEKGGAGTRASERERKRERARRVKNGEDGGEMERQRRPRQPLPRARSGETSSY